jgi:hypothetical protein
MAKSQARLLIPIPENLKARLVELAKQERRSLNKQIEFLLERSICEETKGEIGESARPEGRRR